VQLPVKGTSNSVGLDIFSPDYFVLHPGSSAIVRTGLVVKPPTGYYVQLHIRSGLAAKYGLVFLPSVGIIDPDFCGADDEVIVNICRLPNTSRCLGTSPGVGFTSFPHFPTLLEQSAGAPKNKTFHYVKVSNQPFVIKAGDRIGQLILCKHEKVVVEVIEKTDIESRGGFGSTGA